MGMNSTENVFTQIADSLETKPKNIGEIAEEASVERATASKWLERLEETGLIKGKEMGRQKMYWRYTLSDRMTGLQLRGIAYGLSSMQDALDEASEEVEDLIEKSNDDELVIDGDNWEERED